MKCQLITLIVSSTLSLLGSTLIFGQDVAGDQIAVQPAQSPLWPHSMTSPGPMSASPAIYNSGTLSYNANKHKISMGNSVTTNIHNNHQINAPNVRDSVYTSSTSGHDGHLTAPTNYANGRIEQPQQQPTGPTKLQELLKKKMLELLDKATSDTSGGANSNKQKLQELLRMLDSSRLPEDLLETLLKDAADGHIDEEVPPPPAEEPPAEEPQAPEELPMEEEPGAPEFEIEEEPPVTDEMKDEVRGFIDDRLNRIADLLYFRPEFMNVMMKMDPCNEMTPFEADFVRLVLCNSDASLCNQPACPQPEELPMVGEEEPPVEDAPVEEAPVEEEQPAEEQVAEEVPPDEPVVQASAWPFGARMMHKMPAIPPMPAMPPMAPMAPMAPMQPMQRVPIQMPQLHPNYGPHYDMFGFDPAQGGGVPMVRSTGPAQQQPPSRIRAPAPQQQQQPQRRQQPRPGTNELRRNPNFKMPTRQ